MSDREAEGTHRQCVVHLTTTGKGCSLLPGAGGREALIPVSNISPI